MEDTTWFEEKSEDEKLTHLSELMYSSEENAKKDFETLLNLLPVELVLHISLINIWKELLIFFKSSWFTSYTVKLYQDDNKVLKS